MRARSTALKGFLFHNLYRHPQVMETTGQARRWCANCSPRYLARPGPDAGRLRRARRRAARGGRLHRRHDRPLCAARARAPDRPPAAGRDARHEAASTRRCWCVLAGVSAALHVGKLPPALPVLREALGVSLVQAGFLLSLVQLAGMTLGLARRRWPPIRSGCGAPWSLGLVILSVASAARRLGARRRRMLMLLRARSKASASCWRRCRRPGLIRRLVEPRAAERDAGLVGRLHAARHGAGAACSGRR